VSSEKRWSPSLDPVTFEVLKNAFTTTVDQMAEQILRTCHSFVIYCRDFSSALCDSEGNIIAEGSQDIASHVGTLHFTAKAVLADFGDDMRPGDVFVVNDPYVGGTHLSDVRVVRPIFHGDELIAIAQSNGHWADVGGRVPGSIDFTATEHFSEGIRITPVRVWSEGRYLHDVARLIVSNTRQPEDAEGDLIAQAEATRVAEREITRLADRYGVATLKTAFQEVQDYVEAFTRLRLDSLPDGVWRTEDYLDRDLAAGREGLIPIKIEMTIDGDQVTYDLTGSHPVIGSSMNASFGGSFSGVVGGMKTFFPDIPLNSGFYRPIELSLPEGTVVKAPWPTAVNGFVMPYEKIFNLIIEMWSDLMPQRAMACSFNIEYLEIGGRDARFASRPYFMWYDWMVGGWGGRNGRDGSSATSAVFGVGLVAQPVEGQERLSPAVHTQHELLTDSAGPGRFRGGVGVIKGATLTEAEHVVVSYECDRERSITWGIEGGLPSNPMGVWLKRQSGEDVYLGAAFAGVQAEGGDAFLRPSAGGGGFGDPLERDPAAVLEDVIDEYVSVERATKDYGVVLVEQVPGEWAVDSEATQRERNRIRGAREAWLHEDPELVAARFREGELDVFDLVRRYGVILDWGDGTLLPETTRTFREMLQRRTVSKWTPEQASELSAPAHLTE
jgi:N-methylhydantoinase B